MFNVLECFCDDVFVIVVSFEICVVKGVDIGMWVFDWIDVWCC